MSITTRNERGRIMKPDPNLPPSAYVRAVRAHLNLTRPQLAEKVGVSPRTIEKWENAGSVPRGPALKIMETLL